MWPTFFIWGIFSLSEKDAQGAWASISELLWGELGEARRSRDGKVLNLTKGIDVPQFEDMVKGEISHVIWLSRVNISFCILLHPSTNKILGMWFLLPSCHSFHLFPYFTPFIEPCKLDLYFIFLFCFKCILYYSYINIFLYMHAYFHIRYQRH